MSEQQIANGLIVERYNIIGTRRWVYDAWEPSERNGEMPFSHSTIRTVDGRWMGRIGTRRLPAELEALPAYSSERARAVGAFHEAQYEEAYAAIIAAFPAAEHGCRSMGEIATVEN
jgi:hypothetical protein